MPLVGAVPSDEFRVILCLKFDMRAPFGEISAFKRSLTECDCVVHSVDVSGSFDVMLEAELPDFAAYQALLDRFAEPMATLVERHEANFVSGPFPRLLDRDQTMWVPCREGRRRIEVARIDYVRAGGDYMRIHVGEESWLLHGTMHRLRERLDRKTFLTIHRSTIVNVNFIDRLVHRRHFWVAIFADGSEHRIAKSHSAAVLAELRTDSSMRVGDRSMSVRLGEPVTSFSRSADEMRSARRH